MRLRRIKEILEDIYPINIVGRDRGGSPRTFTLENAIALQEKIILLGQTKMLNKQLEDIKSLTFFNSSNDTLIINDNEIRSLTRDVNLLNLIIENLIISLNEVIPTDTSNIISIKIPEPKNFKDLINTSNKLDKIFSQTFFNQDINGNFQISNFDTGSYWIDVIIEGGDKVMNFVAALVWSGAVIYNKIQEGIDVRNKINEYNLNQNTLKEIDEKNNESIDRVAVAEAEYIHNKYFNSKNNEDINRIKLALKEMAELYKEGTEIYPNIKASEEIKNEFPTMNSISNIKSKIKQLPSKKH